MAGLREKIESHHLAVGVSLGTFEESMGGGQIR